jgi:hypothetical protein
MGRTPEVFATHGQLELLLVFRQRSYSGVSVNNRGRLLNEELRQTSSPVDAREMPEFVKSILAKFRKRSPVQRTPRLSHLGARS